MKPLDGILSWLGIAMILTAYILNVFGVIETRGFLYLILNIAGSVFVVFHAFRRKDYQPAILNIIWALIALVNLILAFG